MGGRSSALFAAAITAVFSSTTQALPLVNISVIGRVQGSGSPFSHFVVPPPMPGDVIEYQIIADMAAVGTTNSNGNRTITSLTVGVDGMSSHRWDLYDTITGNQVAFSSGATLNSDPNGDSNNSDSWSFGAGASGGVPTADTDGAGNDLIGIRPTHTAGLYSAIDPEVVASGTFTLVDAFDLGPIVKIRLTPGGTGGLRINNSSLVPISNTTENGGDPITGFDTMVIGPEPSSAMLSAAAGAGMLAKRRKSSVR
jgi:hypothetical protein